MKKILLAGAAAAVLSAGAQAAELNGTAAVAITGVNVNSASIGLGTTFTNTLFSTIGSGTGDLSGTAGTFLSISTVTATNGSAFSFTSAIGSFSGTVEAASASGPASSRTVELYVLGTFTPVGTLAGFDASPASATFSFTQTGGPESSVSGSFSLAAPPAERPPGVPAPMSLALFGLGLAGLGAVARRKAS